MPEATVTTGFDTRLCALDRAINYAHNCTHGEVLSSDRVLEIAHQFEQYLARTDA